MENKVLVGGMEGLLDLKEKQERMLKEKELELQRQVREEQRLKSELAQQREESRFNKEKFSNLEEECEVKTRKLKKVGVMCACIHLT